MAQAEGALLTQITQIGADRFGMQLFRNTVGGARLRGYWVTFGLAPGSPDMVGYWPLSLNGTTLALFVGVEAKTGRDILRPDQVEFHQKLKAGGAVIFTVWSAQEFLILASETEQELKSVGFSAISQKR